MKRNKYLNQVFDDYKVIYRYISNRYDKIYKDSRYTSHKAYNFILINENTKQTLTLSGNTLRLIARGERKLSDLILNCRSGKNKDIKRIQKELKTKK